MFRALTALMLAGAVAALLGGLAFAVLFSVDDVLARTALPAVLAGLAGLFAMGLLTVLAAATRALAGREPASASAVQPVRVPPRKSDEPDLKTAYDQMRTYIDLEMWELALDKAGYILGKFPGTNEAELVSKNLPEIKWKVETAARAPGRQLSSAEAKQLQKQGLAEMFRHVKTYCDLGMWELARQKAITVMKSFPDSPEADELAKLYPEIERKAAKLALSGVEGMTSETPAPRAPSETA